MKIKYLGSYNNQTRTSGCPVCGGGTRMQNHNSSGFARIKKIMTPLGERTYVYNQVVDVVDKEGEFLLKLTYPHKGKENPMFMRVYDV